MMANFPLTYRVTLGELLPGLVTNPVMASLEVRGLDNNSNNVESGDLFLAIPGGRRDGREFIDEAILRGACAVAYEQAGSEVVFRKQDCVAVHQRPVPVIPVHDLSQQLAAISARYFHHPARQLHCVGVTGTNGKTSCSWWLAHLLVALGKKPGLVGTLGCGILSQERLEASGFTTPDAIHLQNILSGFVQQKATHAVMEVSSHSLEQGRVNEIIFSTALFTNLSRDHLDYHGSMEHYGAAKARLFAMPGLQHAVINVDDAFGASLAAKLRQQAAGPAVIAVSLQQDDAEVSLRALEQDAQGVHGILKTPWGQAAFNAPVYGEYNVANLMGVIAVLCAEGFNLAQVVDAVRGLPAPPGRLEKASKANDDIAVFVDFAHSPDALEKVLTTLKQQFPGQRLCCVFGCGGDRDSGKRPLMGAVATRVADYCVVTSDNPRSEDPQAIIRQILAGKTGDRITVLADRKQAITQAIANALPGDVILLAGKGHEDYQEIRGEKIPFSDVVVAHAALQERRGGRA